jgi:hypothetical protein
MPEAGELLYETRTQQVPGEVRRRWFFSYEQDLLVWVDENGTPVGFQLAYGKNHRERALRWKADQGFSHYSVDDSRGNAGPRTAVLVEGGIFHASEVLKRFIELSKEMPQDVAMFVAARLQQHPEYQPWHRKPGIAAGLSIGLAIAAAGLLLAQSIRRRR